MVKNLSIKLSSWETTFSVINRILSSYFFFINQDITPWQNPKKGCHQSKIMRSAFSFFNLLAMEIQLRGFIEFINLSFGTSFTCCALLSYCVVPGKSIEGYNNL